MNIYKLAVVLMELCILKYCVNYVDEHLMDDRVRGRRRWRRINLVKNCCKWENYLLLFAWK